MHRKEGHFKIAEGEIRDILEKPSWPEGRVELGYLLSTIARRASGLDDMEVVAFHQLKDAKPTEPMRFRRAFSISTFFANSGTSHLRVTAECFKVAVRSQKSS